MDGCWLTGWLWLALASSGWLLACSVGQLCVKMLPKIVSKVAKKSTQNLPKGSQQWSQTGHGNAVFM